MATRETEAFVLRTVPIGDFDRLVVLLSAEDGRIEGVVRGARRFKSRFAAAVEPLSWVAVHYRQRPGRDLCSIDNLVMRRSAFEVMAHPERLTALSHVADVAVAVAVPAEARRPLVRLIHAILDALRAESAIPDDAVRLDLLRLYYDVWVCRLEGFWPDVSACGSCGATLTSGARVGIRDAGALCATCSRAATEPMLRLSSAAVELAAAMLRSGPSVVLGEAAPATVAAELSRVTAALLTSHLGRELRTLAAPRIPSFGGK